MCVRLRAERPSSPDLRWALTAINISDQSLYRASKRPGRFFYLLGEVDFPLQ